MTYECPYCTKPLPDQHSACCGKAGRAVHSYTDSEIDKMRATLAKAWRQSKDQVTETEARFYLDLERELCGSCFEYAHAMALCEWPVCDCTAQTACPGLESLCPTPYSSSATSQRPAAHKEG